jgi:ribosomal RNA-processing protein 9
MLNDTTFVSGDDSGNLAIWSHMKKKPVMSVDATSDSDGTAPVAGLPKRWISSLASVRSADLVASGSSDGFVRLWKATTAPKRLLTRVNKFELPGFVNAMEFSSDGRFIVCATGQEHRLGRWERLKEGKNGLALVNLNVSNVAEEVAEEG